MSVWKIMNWVAWAASAGLLAVMAWDFIKVEKARRSTKSGAGGAAAEDHGKPKD
jgi:hypothetical protein